MAALSNKPPTDLEINGNHFLYSTLTLLTGAVNHPFEDIAGSASGKHTWYIKLEAKLPGDNDGAV